MPKLEKSNIQLIFLVSYIIKINTGTVIRFSTAFIISLEAAF